MKPESSITYVTGYSGITLHELFLIAWGRTHTHTHPHRSDFKKPGASAAGQRMPGLKRKRASWLVA